MLTRTFLHLPGLGLERERQYWEDGILSWEQLLAERDLFGCGPAPSLQEALLESQQRLAAGNARWFEERMGSEHAWRLAPEFDDGQIAYLDIETDGSPADSLADGADRPGGTTVVAIWDGVRARVFLRDHDLDELPAYLSRYRVLCTFNGKLFDLPYLEKSFGATLVHGAHLDLLPITRLAGLGGGLKKIELMLGIERPAMIRHYTGYDAVKLWGAYRRGRRDALEPLARYNLADAMNLQTILRAAYNLAVAQDGLPFRRFDQLRTLESDRATERAIQEIMARAEG